VHVAKVTLAWAGAVERFMGPLTPGAALLFACLWRATLLSAAYQLQATPSPPADRMAGNIVYDTISLWHWLHSPPRPPTNAPGVLADSRVG
jgi:hypothetical protein